MRQKQQNVLPTLVKAVQSKKREAGRKADGAQNTQVNSITQSQEN